MGDNLIQELEQKAQKQPWYIWAGALGAGSFVFYYVMKQRASQSLASSSAANTSTTSTSPDAATNAALNGYDISSMAGLPYGDMSGYTSTSGNPVDNYPVPSPTSGSTPTPASGQQEGLVRPRFNSNTTKAYDTKFPQGVPIHQAPNSSSPVVSFASYASQVAITGTPVTGSNNFGTNNTTGSGLWFPVNGGYISGYDLVGFFSLPGASSSAMAQGSGGYSPFASFLNSGRNTISGHVDAYGLSSE